MAGVQNQDGTDSNKPLSSNISVDKINSSLEKIEISDDKKITKKNKGGAIRKKVPSGSCSKSKEKNSFAKPSPCLSDRKYSQEKLSEIHHTTGKGNRLSASDPSGSVLHLKRSTSGDPIRAPKNSSSSSQSSETARITAAYKRGRRNSDSCPERGHLMQCALRVQHAAHKCSWSGSESTSVSPAFSSSHQSADDMLSLKGASGGLLSSSSSNLKKRPGSKTPSSSSRKGSSRASKQDLKFESYMPLCEVQQGLKKGELIEGVLRINPRNYEDAYISAPDGQMDIFIGGIRDRNRALNGDVVVVQLKPPKEWKILHDALQSYQRSGENFESSASALDLHVPSNNVNLDENTNVEDNISDPWGDINGERPPDTLEILGLEKLTEQFKEFCKEAKNKSRKKKRKGKMFEKSLPVNSDLTDWNNTSFNSSENFDLIKSNSDSVEVYSALNSASEVVPSIPFEEKYISPISSVTKSEYDLSNDLKDSEVTECPISNTLEQEGIEDCNVGDNSSSHTFAENKLDNSWTTGVGSCSDNLIVSPEDLLTFEDNEAICLMQTYPDDTGETSSDRDKNYSTDEGGIAVAPEDLSEDEFSDSLSGESTCSHHLDQLLEDAAFYASQQDAKNNNMDFSSANNEFNFSTNVQIIHEELNSDTESLAADSSLANCEFESASFEKEITVHLSQDDHSELNSDLSCSLASSSTQNILSYASHVPASLSSVVKDKMLSTSTTDTCEDYSVLETHNSQKSLYDSNCTLETLISEQSNSNQNDMCELSNTNIYKDTDKEKQLQRPKKKKKRSKKKKNSALKDTITNSKPTNYPIELQSQSVEDLMKHPQWQKFIQKTGKVVYILEKKHTRCAAGVIKLLKDKNKNVALFSPNDHRLPRVLVPMITCPQDFYERSADYAKTLFIARITDWEQSSLFAKGVLIKSLGDKGEIEPETEGILLENDVDFSDFPDNVLNNVMFQEDWKPSPEEIARRRDFRSHCVFTIDPSTARDLDDALSCQLLDNECLEVGVHIADVTYFVQLDSPLDNVAQQRATSVYLVQKVIPMLPHVLCDQLCSLNPGEDRLTFSVVWHLNRDGEILNEWAGHSVIRSCMKMSYEHAQDMIENPTKDWNELSLPPIYGNFTLPEIITSVLQLHQLAVKLRAKRFEDGALRLDQIKLHFTLDSETGLPSGFSVHEQKDSHRLVEEFMLLANRSVAQRIFKAFPNDAFLRWHPPPHHKMMEDLANLCAALGVHLDISSAGALQASLNCFPGQDSCSKAKVLALTALCSKPMNRALYYCSSDEGVHQHYALNVPLYTHFTSPIRRYPDIVVHRLLAASLGYSALPTISSSELKKLATHCNDKKWMSKRVQELSSELFLAVFIKECGPLEEMAVVMGVMDHAFDVLILRMGVVKRIYCDKLSSAKLEYENKYVPHLTLVWQTAKGEVRTNISIFTMVEVTLEAVPNEPLRYNVILKNPYEDVKT